MKLKTFPRGGIHPPDRKITKDTPIEVCPLPEEAVVLLGQHIGAPAQAVVEPRAAVKVGTLIGKAPGLISANIHSPVSGTVKKIETRTDASGYPRTAIVITVQGDEWEPNLGDFSRTEEGPAGSSWNRLPFRADLAADADAIRQELVAAGVVGMGGAGFPSAVKYMLPPGKFADTVLINGVECEPYLTADHRLMLEAANEVLAGAELLRMALGVERCIVGIEANKPDALAVMDAAAATYSHIRVQGLAVKYPQGAEKQLIRALTGREVPSGKLPLDVGCVVNNVGTAFAAYAAVQHGLPLVERIVTVTGAVARPGNYLVRLGTPVSFVLEQAGGMLDGAGKVVLGGPMMGKATADLGTPVTKTTSGILVLEESSARRKSPQPCIRCSRCVGVCPMGLEPYLLAELSRMGRLEEAERLGATDCVECGSCSYTCPSDRELLDWIRLGKAKILADRRNRRAS